MIRALLLTAAPYERGMVFLLGRFWWVMKGRQPETKRRRPLRILNMIAGDKSHTIVFAPPMDLYQSLPRRAAKSG